MDSTNFQSGSKGRRVVIVVCACGKRELRDDERLRDLCPKCGMPITVAS